MALVSINASDIPSNITGTFDKDNTTALPYGNDITDTPYTPVLPATFIVVHFGFRLLWSVFAVFGNLLTLIAVVRYETLHNNTSYLICSLTMADMLGGCLSPMVIAHQVLVDDPVFIPLCLVEKYLSMVSISCNTHSILWIAVDRYIYISHPLRYPTLVTSTRTFAVIGCIWLYTTGQFAIVFVWGQKLRMGMTCKFSVFLNHTVYNNILMPQILVKAIVTVGLYIAIANIAYKQGKAIAALNQPYDTHEATVNRQQKRIAKMMITVLGTFFVAYIPQSIASVLLGMYSTSMSIIILEKITELIYWVNTWANPIIYAWKSRDFRVAFRKILGLKTSNSVVAAGAPAPALNG